MFLVVFPFFFFFWLNKKEKIFFFFFPYLVKVLVV